MCAQSPSRLLPYYGSPLVGRDDEVSMLRGLIADTRVRLITVTGTAGVGKTRLSIFTAEDLAERDTLFISLAAVNDPELVLAEIGKALELHGDELISKIRDRLNQWDGVILLDNFEQVISASSVIAEIIPPNPNLTVIVTSQRPLQIEGERVVRLDPLPTPVPETSGPALLEVPSVQLLVNRAAEQDASFMSTLWESSTSEAVAEICRRLDGIPLALELAASRVNSLSPEVVLAQLESGHGILSTQRRDTPERQRTMHAAIAWSYCLLPAETQRTFLWLGAFTAGFDLPIVERLSEHLGISTPAFETVSELVDASLVRRVKGGANPWYTMLFSIREFCLAELDASGERMAAEEVVSDHVVRLAQQMKADLSSTGFGDLLPQLDRELATIRSAVNRSLKQGDPILPLVAAAGIQHVFQQTGGWRELVGWIDAALELPELVPPEVLLDGLLAKMSMQEEAREREGVVATDELIRKLLEDNHLPVMKLRYLVISGSIAMNETNWPVAEQQFERVLQLARAEKVERAESAALANLGGIAFYRKDYPRAEKYLERAKSMFDQSGNLSYKDRILTSLAAVANEQGKFPESLMYLKEALNIEDQLGLRLNRVYTLLTLSTAYGGLNDLDAASVAAEEAIIAAGELGYTQLAVIGYIRLAKSALVREDIASIYENVVQGVQLQAKAEDPREYVSLGILVAGALDLESRHSDAAAMLGGCTGMIDEIDYCLDLQEQELFDDLATRLQKQLPDYDHHIQTGESWEMETFIRKMTWAAKRFAGRTAGILVKVAEKPSTALPEFTPRENQILALLVEGNSTHGMAEILSLSPRTVTTHIGNMMTKLGVNSRTELVAKTLRGEPESVG